MESRAWNNARSLLHAAIFVLLSLFLSPPSAFPQNALPAATNIHINGVHIPLIERAPALEDFAAMQASTELAHRMTRIDRFTQRNPHDGKPASQRTEAYLGYTAKNLYVVFLCFDSEPNKIRAHMNRREDIQEDDQIGLMIDTFNDHRHAYTIYVNPVGVQQDGTFTEGNEPDLSFDTVWNSSAHMTKEGYVAWFEIPFKSLRFPHTPEQKWGVLFERDIPRNNEASFYPPISSNEQGILSQETTVDGMKEISPGRNMQFNPYGSFRTFHALDTRDPNQARYSNRLADMRVGLDSKFILKDSLVLDTTINPDFAQVESDEPQTTVNQRFEVFFPEKRPFFQENSGYFDTPVNMVFTRRIADPTYGIRLTGKVGHWGVGTLLADDRSPGKSVIDSDPLSGHRAYYGVMRVTRDLWKDSNIGFIYTDRELKTSPDTTCTDLRCTVGFNRVAGIDSKIRFSKQWVGNFQALTSSTKFNDGSRLAGPSYQAYVEQSSKKLEFNTLYIDTAPGFDTEMGFYRRPDIRRFSNFAMYRFYRKEKSKMVWHGPSVFTINNWDHSGTRLEYFANTNYRWVFRAQTVFGVYTNYGHERLRPVDYDTLLVNQDYAHYQRGFFFSTGLSKTWTFNSEVNWGQDTNYSPRTGAPFVGTSGFTQAGLNVRPAKGLSITNTYLLSRLRDKVTQANIFNAHIIRSKWNYQFNRELSLRFIGQYNATLSNPLYTTLQNTKNFNADFLVTYMVHPGTAVYVGYNSNLQNLDPSLANTPDGLLRTRDRFLNDGRQVFVKISYLFRY
jgi:hypothetical protein